MKNYAFIIIISFLDGCYGGTHQEIILVNKSKSDVFYCLYNESIPSSLDIQNIRPWSDNRIKEHHRNLKFDSKEDSLENAKTLKTAFLTKKGKQNIIFMSRGVSIYNNKDRIQNQIKEEYFGALRVLLITENNLISYSNADIINKKLYNNFLIITEKDIIKDTLIFVYK